MNVTSLTHDVDAVSAVTNLTDYELQAARINNIVYYSMMIPLAICGNVFTLTAVIMVLKIKASIPNLLIGVLACTDLVSIFTCHLISMASMAQGHYIGSRYVCHFQSMMAYTYFKMGFLTKCCISLDRYIALAYPLKYRRLITMKRMVAVIIHNIIFSFGTSVLTLLIDPEYIHELPTWYMCVNDFRYHTEYKLVVIITEGVVFFLGVILFFVSNITVIKVMLELDQRGKKLFSIGYFTANSDNPEEKAPDESSESNSVITGESVVTTNSNMSDDGDQTELSNNNNSAPKISDAKQNNAIRKGSIDILSGKLKNWTKAFHKANEKVKVEKKKQNRRHRELQFAKLVMIIVTVFVILWIPYMIVIYWEQHRHKPAPYFVEDIVIKLVFANCCFNPIIYGVFNANFRQAYVYYLRMMAFYFTCKTTKKPQGMESADKVHNVFQQANLAMKFRRHVHKVSESSTDQTDISMTKISTIHEEEEPGCISLEADAESTAAMDLTELKNSSSEPQQIGKKRIDKLFEDFRDEHDGLTTVEIDSSILKLALHDLYRPT